MTESRASPNEFERDKPRTDARDVAEGSIERLRQRGGIFVEAVRATRMAMALTDPTLPGNPIVFANPSFLDLTGYSMDEVLGQQPHFMNGPDTDPEDAERFRRILEADQDGVVETVQYAKDGRRFVATVLLSAFKADDGRTLHHFLSWADVTRRVDAEEDAAGLRATQAALRESEERLRQFGEAAHDILWIRHAETLQWVYLTPAFETIYGLSREEALKGDNYRSWLDLIVPEDREHAQQAIEKVRAGQHVTFEYRIRRPSDGTTRRLRNTDFPIADGTGSIPIIGGISHDVTELRESEERRRSSEERFGLIVENTRDYAIFTTDPDGRIDRWYDGAAAVFGWTEAEAVGQFAEITFTPEDRAGGKAAEERDAAARDGRVPDVRWHFRKDGKRIFIEGIASALRDEDGELTGFLKIGQNVTERRRAEERQNILLAELQHRVRNIMAMLRSVARRTGETAETVDDYVQHFEGRISAMARTQALLTRDVNAAVDLQNLLLDELEMQAAQPEQYRITGPDVSLPPKAAEVLGLALHELATNAVKYGALSGEHGWIDVRWALLGGEGKPLLSLIWSELGVSIDGAPSRQGFGTELITQRVPYELQGTGTMEFRPTGLVATLEFPLEDIPSILQTDDGREKSS
ncbi:PAS domain S-box protein [Sphingomonas desiccabilis]|nr:PAS domain S-box protein [Sphingomonas desiccabilis]MBB3909548.1 two-component system CheB/CheR fusion protein [Sphingomonas desiccabilis]